MHIDRYTLTQADIKKEISEATATTPPPIQTHWGLSQLHSNALLNSPPFSCVSPSTAIHREVSRTRKRRWFSTCGASFIITKSHGLLNACDTVTRAEDPLRILEDGGFYFSVLFIGVRGYRRRRIKKKSGGDICMFLKFRCQRKRGGKLSCACYLSRQSIMLNSLWRPSLQRAISTTYLFFHLFRILLCRFAHMTSRSAWFAKMLNWCAKKIGFP